MVRAGRRSGNGRRGGRNGTKAIGSYSVIEDVQGTEEGAREWGKEKGKSERE